MFVSSASGPNSIHISGSQDVIIQNWNLYRPVRVFEWNGDDYGVNGKYIFKRVQTNWTLHDSLVGDYTTSGTAIDKSDGKVLINTNFGNQVYDMQTGMLVRYPVRPNCSWNSGIGEFSYARKRLAFSNYFGGVGLFYYPKYNFKEELALGPLRYSFEYEHYFKSYAYMDTIGRTIPMSFFDGFNVTAKMQGQRKAAALVQHGGRESDWVFGPISNVSYRPSCHDKYGYVMKVLKSEVDYHKLNYNQTGYVTPMSIANWPGNGRVWEGESLTLAPFYDANNNGSFEPNFGDYPLIPGDECIYAMYNEPIKNSQYGLGLEVHRFAYIFKNGATVNQKTVYHHFAVVNRSGQTLDSLQFSLLSDMDLGNQSNDIGLMDTTTNAFYTMNSQIDKGVFNHGTYPYQIAEGFTSLDHRIVSHNIQWPFSFNELMNQVNGKYADGTPIYDSTLYTTGKFEYLWDGDTSLTFVRKGYWQGQDTRQVSYLEPITLLPNEKACFNFAFTYDVLNDSLDHWGALKLTQSRMQNIRSHWQNQGSVMCLMPTLAEEEFSQIDFKIYPNPSSGKFKIQSLEPIEQIELVDVQGRTILLRKANAKIIEIDEKLNSGLYVVKIMVNRSWISQRLMVLD